MKIMLDQQQYRNQAFRLFKISLDQRQSACLQLCSPPPRFVGLINMTKIPPECQKCGIQICKQCMMKNHVGPCDQNFQQNFKQWKRCPKCKVFIQKSQGCNHMVCRCKHQFCYVCLSPFTPTHYQCIEKQDILLFQSQSTNCPKILGFLMIILFPLVLCLDIGLLTIVLALSVVGGMILGVTLVCENMRKQDCLWCLPCLFPCAVVVCTIFAPIVLLIVLIIPAIVTQNNRYWYTVFALCQQN